MNILVIGGMHGNELLGVQLVQSLQRQPIEGVSALIANPRAVKNGARYVETDLNRSFGTQPSDTYERRRAKALLGKLKRYDAVLDFHNTETPQNNCCFVGVESEQLLYETAKRLGFSNCVQATYDCINKYAPNVLSIEISVGDARDDVEYWRTVIGDIARLNSVESTGLTLSVYRYARRVTWEDQTQHRICDWEPFKQISQDESRAFGVATGSVPIFIGSRLTEYYATLLEPVPYKPLNLANNR